jgi:hypothetical protein
MAVKDVKFCQHAVADFHTVDSNSTANISDWLCNFYEDSCIDANSVSNWATHLKLGNANITDLPCCRHSRISTMECGKLKVDELIMKTDD